MSDPPRLARLFGFGPGQVKVGPLSVRQWVWVFAVVSVVVQVFLSYLATAEFRQGAYDLGITVQGLSNVGAGRFFWSTGNHLHHGTVSLLNSHFSWVYFVVYPVYVAIPGIFTLFVVQAVAIGVAAVPLEALATQTSGSPRRGMLVAGLYALWAPMYAGMPNSFHLEAFLPVLFFALVLVWIRRQYVLGLALAALAGFTIDVAPILTALLAIVFLTLPLQEAYRGSRVRPPPTESMAVTKAGLPSPVRDFLRSPLVQACVALFVLSVVVFLAMRLLEANLTNWLGIPGSSLGVFRNPGSALSNLSIHLGQKVEFWILMGATVGFLPLLYPRILIVLVPWMGYTALQAGNGWFSLPSHYVAIAAVPLFLGIALGIRGLPLPAWLLREPSPRADAGELPESSGRSGPWNETAPSGSGIGPRAWRRRRPIAGSTGRAVRPWTGNGSAGGSSSRRARKNRVATACGILVLAVIATNVAISPVNFATNGLLASTGNRLFVSSASPYGLTPFPAAGYEYVESLAAELPSQAFVLVQGPLFPLVAHDPNAYIFASLQSQGYVEREPFNNSTPPEFVFATIPGTFQFDQLVANLSTWVWDTSVYGLVGWVQTTPIGSVFLFEKGYAGPTQIFGPIAPPTIRFSPGNYLVKGASGHWRRIDNAAKVPIIVVSSSAGQSGELWSVSQSSLVLPAGAYNLTIEMRTDGSAANCSEVPASAVVLDISGNSSGHPSIINSSIPYFRASCGAWVQVSLPFTLDQPASFVAFAGTRPVLPPLPIQVAVAQVSIVPAASPTP